MRAPPRPTHGWKAEVETHRSHPRAPSVAATCSVAVDTRVLSPRRDRYELESLQHAILSRRPVPRYMGYLRLGIACCNFFAVAIPARSDLL